jgi:hypothetical protein
LKKLFSTSKTLSQTAKAAIGHFARVHPIGMGKKGGNEAYILARERMGGL